MLEILRQFLESIPGVGHVRYDGNRIDSNETLITILYIDKLRRGVLYASFTGTKFVWGEHEIDLHDPDSLDRIHTVIHKYIAVIG